jgi:hypothetical protein
MGMVGSWPIYSEVGARAYLAFGAATHNDAESQSEVKVILQDN